MIHVPTLAEREEKVRETYEAMYDVAVNLGASYDSISYAAAALIAMCIIKSPKEPGFNKEDVINAIEKYISDMLAMHGVYKQ